MPISELTRNFRARQQDRFISPHLGVQTDFEAVYKYGEIEVGWPEGVTRIFENLARPNSKAIVGIALGDEGKGRIIDNEIQAMLAINGIRLVNVIRYQGGNNAGHTIKVGERKLALHQVPSGVMYEQTVGIMDKGMIINPDDLVEEIKIVEAIPGVGNTRDKVYLSPDAILNTDLERAEELLNRHRDTLVSATPDVAQNILSNLTTVTPGKAGGGTGRGIGPSYAHHVDRLGLHVFDLMDDNWKETLGKQYDRYEKEFHAYGIDISSMLVPDFAKTKETKKEQKRFLGSKAEFLDRLEAARTWLIERDMVKNTYILHRNIYNDLTQGVLLEGAQAVGIGRPHGTQPDVSGSDPSVYGIHEGTGYWMVPDIAERIGIFKLTYTSSVGSRHMPTEAHDDWSRWVREEAHEYGTTTGRPRDILYLDLAMLGYNIHMSGAEMLAGTHLDLAREGESIKVCTHYTNEKGDFIPYQSGLRYQKDIIPHYVELPGWDGKAVSSAKSFAELPENAKKFLSFLQRRLGTPIIAATTGPERENYLQIPDSLPPKVTLMGGFD